MPRSKSFKIRIWITTGLLTTSLICTALAAKKRGHLTAKQSRALRDCSYALIDCNQRCEASPGIMGLRYCCDRCTDSYNACLDAAGIPREGNPPPKVPITKPSPVTGVAGTSPTPAPTPSKRKPILPVKG